MQSRACLSYGSLTLDIVPPDHLSVCGFGGGGGGGGVELNDGGLGGGGGEFVDTGCDWRGGEEFGNILCGSVDSIGEGV